MSNRIAVTFQGDYVQAIADGEKSLEFARRLWTKIVATCKEHRCFRVLGVANTSLPLDILDAYDHGELFRELGIAAQYRIAWVEQNPAVIDAVRLVETVLYNRGINARVFDEIDTAKYWLLSNRDD